MSDETTSGDPASTEAVSSAAADASTPQHEKRPRSSVERAIVWSVIGILLVVAGIQGMAAYGYSVSQDRIAKAMEEAESSKKDVDLRLDRAENLMAGFWSRTDIKRSGDDRFVVYKWSGVYQSYTILLTVGAETVGTEKNNPSVIGYELNSTKSRHAETLAELSGNGKGNSAPPAEDGAVDASGNGEGMPVGPQAGHGAGGEGANGGGGGGQEGGGRPRLAFGDLDEDGDGKVNKEDLPERMQEFFDRIDTNGDDSIDAAEWEARPRRGRPQNGEGGGEGDGNRPRRPVNEGEQPSTDAPAENGEPAPPAAPEETDSP